MNNLDNAVNEAVDNEAMECTKEERDSFIYLRRAYDNAASYADQFGVDVEEFRFHLCATRHYCRACDEYDMAISRWQSNPEASNTMPVNHCTNIHF